MLPEAARFSRVLLRQIYLAWLPLYYRRSMVTRVDIMQAGDRILLKGKGKDAFMTKRLEHGGTTASQTGGVRHSDIVGKKSGVSVKATKGPDVRAHLPTLAEYVTMVPRKVTPIYPSHANLIVSLLDINVDASHCSSESGMMEILEAGTGHASLTLYLARAIHAANQSQRGTRSLWGLSILGGAPIEEAKSQRKAVIHTIDISPSYSRHAQQVVSGFRRGMYSNDIDFHVGDVSDWIRQQSASRDLAGGKTFLSHILLDMPNAHDHLATATAALHVDGALLVFNPSVSQIMDVVQTVRQNRLPLELERVVEVGHGMTGGKEWVVRCVKPRTVLRARADARTAQAAAAAAAADAALKPHPSMEAETIDSSEADISDQGGEEMPAESGPEGEWNMVCRPKVGYMVSGGGFVALFKKRD